MRDVSLNSGEVAALGANLADAPDPLALYGALSSGGRRPATMMFETEERAIILEQAAVEAVCRGAKVELRALTANGIAVLNFLERELDGRCTRHGGDRLELEVGRPTSDDPRQRLFQGSAFDALRALLLRQVAVSAGEPFTLILAGILAFDFVDLVEELPQDQHDPLEFPDYIFWLAESLVVIDRSQGTRVVSIAFGSDDREAARRSFEQAGQRLEALVKRCSPPDKPRPSPGPRLRAATSDPAPADLDDEAFAGLVEELQTHIRAGGIYQIVPSRTFRSPCGDPLAAFARQRQSDPSPYMFYASTGSHILFGASPETAVRLNPDCGRTLEVKPIAGTRRRGGDADEDDRLEADLRFDDKELAEHMMLVDLARNDVAQVAVPGTRRVSELLKVERYAHVMHLVSRVEGELRPECDAFHALQACLNVGTLSGAPKLRATELLRRYERTRRGPYGGAIGWISGSGAMDTGVIIRSAVVKDGIAHVRAGAGVVQQSVPRAEAEETRAKAAAVLRALGPGA